MQDLRKPIKDLIQFDPVARKAVFKTYCFEGYIGYDQQKPLWKDSALVVSHAQSFMQNE
jgi:hypothetical protein